VGRTTRSWTIGISVVFALGAVVLVASVLPEEKGRAVAWHDLSSQVGPLRIVGPEARVFRDRATLADYLQRAGARRAAPPVDFSARQLLLVSSGPRSSTGYAVGVPSVREHGGDLTVRIRERTPRLGERVAARVTYPYRLLSLPAGKDVDVDWLGR